jgi:membrane protease YdiL (CAAX protease family)
VRRELLWPFAVYLVQIPILIGCASGMIPIHPIAIVLPLVVFLNARVDGRGPEGLGLIVAHPARSLLLVFVFAVLGLGRRLIVLRLENIPIRCPPVTVASVGSVAMDLAVDLFIIALWEEIVNRGYVQTRLQQAWGFRAVLVTTLMFASLHLPSAIYDYGWGAPVPFRFVHTGLAGFLLGCVYWWTGSSLTTIGLHGLRNYVLVSLILRLGGLSAAGLQLSQMLFQLLWLMAEVGLAVLVCRAFFGSSPAMASTPEGRFHRGLGGRQDREAVR